MRILSELVFIPQTQESIGCCMTFPDFSIFFIEQLFLIFNNMLSIIEPLVGVQYLGAVCSCVCYPNKHKSSTEDFMNN